MRSSTFSSLAFVASTLLVNGVFSSPLGERAIVTDKHIVYEEVIVVALPGGGYRTGKAKAFKTKTIKGSLPVETPKPIPAVVEKPTTTSTISTTSSIPKPTTTSSPAPAVFKEAKPTTTAAPAPVEPVVAPAPVQSTTPPAPAPVKVVKPATSAVKSVAAPIASAITPSGGKRGIAYNDASLLNAFKGTSATWAYNWGGNTQDIPSEFEFVPMLWGLDQHANNWESFADRAIAAGSKHLLAFNEPDHVDQANLDVGKAAAGYMTHMNPYAGKAKLGSPAVTNGGAPMGLSWLGGFMDACSSCQIDFVALHWYNGGDANAFKTYIENAREVAGGRKIWITEFEAPGSPEEKTVWLAEVLPWLDSQDYVERYSYFMASEGSLITGGALSTIGQAYVS